MDRLWCALVIKDGLKGDNKNIPDVKFCWAKDFDSAAKVFANANWPQYFWVEGKSVCRVIKLFEIFSDEFMEEHGEDLESVLNREVFRCLPMEQANGPIDVEERTEEKGTSPPIVQRRPDHPQPEPQQSRRRRRKTVKPQTDDTGANSSEESRMESGPEPSRGQSLEEVAGARRSRRLKKRFDDESKNPPEKAGQLSQPRRRRRRKTQA